MNLGIHHIVENSYIAHIPVQFKILTPDLELQRTFSASIEGYMKRR